MKSAFEVPRQMRGLGSSAFRAMTEYVNNHIACQPVGARRQPSATPITAPKDEELSPQARNL
ncbi:MAG: hypothetical protein ACJ8E1_18645, partial [Xanthobacteraceae bacterium]